MIYQEMLPSTCSPSKDPVLKVTGPGSFRKTIPKACCTENVNSKQVIICGSSSRGLSVLQTGSQAWCRALGTCAWLNMADLQSRQAATQASLGLAPSLPEQRRKALGCFCPGSRRLFQLEEVQLAWDTWAHMITHSMGHNEKAQEAEFMDTLWHP